MLHLLIQRNMLLSIALGDVISQARRKAEVGSNIDSPEMDALGATARRIAHNLTLITATAHGFLSPAEFAAFVEKSILSKEDVALHLEKAYLS